MTSDAVITTWQQAFEENRVPQIRAIEKNLRARAARNKEKLRNTVGGSYRELLATAEAIVSLQAKAKVAEEHLASISHNCRPPQQDVSPRPPSADKVALAQMRLLQRCCTTSATALRTRDLLQCAQLVVISRLLLKSLGDQQEGLNLASSLELLRNKIAMLRRQLLRQVDSKLVNPVSSRSDLVEALCSYCLVTSVSAEDALSHCRQLRLDKLRRWLSQSADRTIICQALRYQLASLQTFKSVAGRPLTDAMNGLQKRPILDGPALKDLETLDLDRTWPLLPKEIKTFVPYFKRSVSTPDATQAALETWSQEASHLLSGAMDGYLSSVKDMTAVLELRKELYTTLLPSYFSTPAGMDIIQEIRWSLNQRLSGICQAKGLQLTELTRRLVEGVTTSTANKPKLLWDDELVQADLGNTGVSRSGSRFIKQVKNRHAGLNLVLAKASKRMDAWISSANATRDEINQLPKIRWRDIIEEPEEEDDQEDQAAALVRELCETDPESYTKALRESLHEALEDYEKNMIQTASTIINDGEISNPPSDGNINIIQAVTLLRSIRMSLASLHQAFPGESQKLLVSLDNIITDLNRVIANEVARQLSQALQRKRRGATTSGNGNGNSNSSNRPKPKLNTSAPSHLPDGMPSPTAFSTLRTLCKIMLDLGGTDLWSPPAAMMVKDAVRHQIFETDDAGKTKSLYTVTEFDEAYLGAALSDNTNKAPNQVEADSKAMDTKTSQKAAAVDYWTRTKLLFGLLA
ncbi:hypothetical protein HRR83_001959 [Exophiala dermatitidis]|uniref:Conserved oligomeric Golgi complex subunit 1 n=2 Tax=Exophiala dermatitidis TaxID=5970 RepID=H6BZA9_EXODN|nr:uncharacterized protein HMPREF1120_05029 [Exophiala dermatitidis NIH/UT8656]KAJ4514392.1 hypothetical protein HRR73_005419 [Exophiala dermatitidis]EHY56972.1 hypothetical protein HMPREF1120_05029 [Exophiala dermatitidis NIH/UT8656]KAJ4520006.1 hypothetical protein HRR75_001868 [Exophiala dermatitidis]KAJ4523842.1 hypothetical protein HRR74_002036 [Exophiala dermatitidis]KAJ4537219.1 hypothetical protein HRR76_005232 [Exophiala dermatitidis]